MAGVGEPAELGALRAHRGEVTCADVSGAWLATGGGDGALRLWRWRRGAGWEESAEESRAHRYGVTAARWAPTGVLLASAGVDGAARLWASRSLRGRLALLAPHAAAARSTCWATGERLLVGHDDGAVRAWRVSDGALLACVRAFDGALHALTALGGATLLLAACTQGVLKIFSLEEVCNGGTEVGGGPAPLLWEDGAHDLGALCAAGSACGRAAATGGQDARVRLWRAAAGGAAAAGALSGHGGAVTALRWARDAALLVSASLDRTARVWAVEARACVRVLPAHPRYLTCVAVPPHARYMVTGSNDKTIRTWSLGALSIEDDLEPECSPLVHFGLGDLEGIGPVDDDYCDVESPGDAAEGGAGGAQCVWRERALGAAVNCIATHGALLATACSDGTVRIFRWSEEEATLVAERALAAHEYPALAAEFSAGGALLLSAGLDGRACLWDVQTGREAAAVWAGAEGEGGGGVRGARLSPHHPPLALLATDAGVAALWSFDDDATEPVHVYEAAGGGGGAACTCAAWAAGGAAAAAGGAGGALLLLAPPPAAAELARCTDAHDLGVLSVDFAPEDLAGDRDEEDEESEDNGDEEEEEEEERLYLLASGGMDELVKLWAASVRRGATGAARGELALRCALAAHGGAVQSVRWGARRTLATAGADRWARVWRVSCARRLARVNAQQVAAVPAGGAGGAAAAAFLRPDVLAVGALAGRLALWRLPAEGPAPPEDGVEPRWWGLPGVLRWLRDYVAHPSDEAGAGALLAAAARGAALTGARLLDEPLDRLLEQFGYGVGEEALEAEGEEAVEAEGEEAEGAEGEEAVEAQGAEGAGAACSRLLEELQWLRSPLLSYEEEARVPHALRCALSHAAPRWPVRASDGYTYEHAALAHWLLAAGAVSPLSGRRLRGAPAPNRGVLRALRAHLAADRHTRQHHQHPQ